MDMLVMKNTANNAMYIVQKWHTSMEIFNEITSKVSLQSILFPSIFSLHSLTNLSIYFYTYHLQFL